ncbi:MAG TPA: ABC transporter permease [Bryobacteraceae bacterium]|nr:ABC transporter permease [Bryobacteraceae bacterium]
MLHFWEALVQDARYAFRGMAGSKLFTGMAVLSLALGIGANTAIYSFMDSVMFRALPVKHSEQLVILNWRAKSEAPVVHSHWGSNYDEPGGGLTSPNFPYPVFDLLRNHKDVLASLFGHVGGGQVDLVIDGQAELATGQYVTGSFFEGLGVSPAAGRLINLDDDRVGAPAIAVITDDYWHTRFAGSPSVVGKHILINKTPFTVAGVAAPDFYGVSPNSKPSVFLPMASIVITRPESVGEDTFHDGTYYWIELMGRLRSGVTLMQAQAQLAGPFHGFVQSTATKERERADLPSLWLQEGGSGVDALRRQYSKPLWILMTMVGLILAVACFNIANLLLARAASRRREIALRLSLGAGRFRIVRQLLTESIVLALLSGIAGVGVAALCIRFLLLLLNNGNDNFTVNVGLDWRVLSFTLLAAFVSGIFFGLAPALQATRVDLTPALKETRASESRGKVRHLGVRWGLSQGLVVAQIGISVLLVVAAGLFVRTVTNLHSVSLGFNAENILVFDLDATRAGYKEATLKQFYAELERRFQAIPGVRGATSSDIPLVGGWSSSTSIGVPGIPEPPEGQRGPNTSLAQVGTTFFETMQIPIVAGRAIDKRDVEGAPAVGVVNPVLVEKYFHGENPVGRHFRLGGTKGIDIEIVGVARTARYSSLKRAIPPVTYTSWLQTPKSRRLQEMVFELRTSGNPLALANTVRQIVHQVGPQVPLAGITTQSRRIDETILQERTFAQLCACFGGLALLMACVGLYGTMAYAVARRTGEIGIRMALGATRGHVVWMVLREVAALCAFGLLIGLGSAYKTTVFVKSFLFGVAPNDPLAIGVSAAILVACALLAGYLPAFRASRIDPVVALRNE